MTFPGLWFIVDDTRLTKGFFLMSDTKDLERQQKEAFALKLLRPDADPYKIAFDMFPSNNNRAIWVAAHWPNDPEVLAIKQTIRDNDKTGESFLPTETDFKMAVWDRMKRSFDDSDFAKLAKLYAESNGFIKKESNVTVNTQIMPKVIVIKDHGNLDQWESAAQKQQKELLNVSDTRH